MKKINKTIIIIAIYLIHLFFYVGMSFITFINMSNWDIVLKKFNIHSNISQYNHLYISIFYIILSTYFMFKSLNFHFKKMVKVLIYTTSYAFVFIAIYKYYSIKHFVRILLIAIGLILSLNALYKKINICNHVF